LTSRTLGRSAWLAVGLVLAVLVGLFLLQSLGPGALVPISAVIAAPPVGTCHDAGEAARLAGGIQRLPPRG
jgi:hypothetical protein